MTGPRILIAEDDGDFALLLSELLEEEGFQVTLARDGRQAVDLLSRDRGFGLMLLDMMLPELDGYAVLAAIRAAGSPVPVVVLTALPAREDRDRLRQSGVRAVLSKPVSLDLLLARVRETLEPPTANSGPEPAE